ncbi:hypothetical protein BB559_003367 [Furculomyces boomerangus]|uniref:Clp R domain-containing protein n=2 Tax=Harpellales TaxID=61421 RepID=A0A2T9YLW0_9FUNG|nr:hypothetical protein BB559_003367 [Furculomyces boomerangus]PWA00424.1 hypothetical protein BB558_003522 [Smittium angustum]
MDIDLKFGSSVYKIISDLESMMDRNKRFIIDPIHIFEKTVSEENFNFWNYGISQKTRILDQIKKETEYTDSRMKGLGCNKQYGDFKDFDLIFGGYTCNVFLTAKTYMEKYKSKHICIDILLLSLITDKSVQKVFRLSDCSIGAFENRVLDIIKLKNHMQTVPETSTNYYSSNNETSIESSETLSTYGTNMVKLAEEGKYGTVIGRDAEMAQMINILCRKTKTNVILVGEPGVGKTALIEELALRISKEDVPKKLLCRLISLDIPMIISKLGLVGSMEKIMKDIINEASTSEKRVVLFIDEIHTIVNSSDYKGTVGIMDILKPALARGEISLIGATTEKEYKIHIKKDLAFERRFQQLRIPEPSEATSIAILRGLKDKYTSYFKVSITDSAIVSAVRLSAKYIPTRKLPDKAIDLIEEACAKIQIQNEMKSPEELLLLEKKKNAVESEIDTIKNIISNSNENNIESENWIPFCNEEENLKSELGENLDELQIVDKKVKEYNQERSKYIGIIAQIKVLRYQLRTIKKCEDNQKNKEKANNLKNKIKNLVKLVNNNGETRNRTKDKEKIVELSTFVGVVTATQIGKLLSQKTGIPVESLQPKTLKAKAESLEKTLLSQIFGQNEVIKLVSNAIKRSSVGITDPTQPIGCFLFLGPTGVGKTEVAKAIAKAIFGDRKRNISSGNKENKSKENSDFGIIRVDMSEYSEKHNVARFIGSPPGYIGSQNGGQLTEAVLKNPYSAILFDEVEKAHPDVLNILLGIMDDGRLTDAQGTTVDFTNTIIIITSNIGQSHILSHVTKEIQEQKKMKRDGVDFSDNENIYKLPSEIKANVLNEARKTFRAELINRFDSIAVFNLLGPASLGEIVKSELKKIEQRIASNKNVGLGNRGIKLEMKKSDINEIVKYTSNPIYGARQIKRFILNTLTTGLADHLISKPLKQNSVLKIGVKFAYKATGSIGEQEKVMGFSFENVPAKKAG